MVKLIFKAYKKLKNFFCNLFLYMKTITGYYQKNK